MAKHPWFKFNPSAWRADEALAMCSPEARLLWLEMLCLMHNAEPRGHLLVNGLEPSLDQLAAQVRMKKTAVKRAIFELENAKVFSRNEAGIIVSRRMVREGEVSEKAKENVEKRWEMSRLRSDLRNTQQHTNLSTKSLRDRDIPPPTPPEGGGANDPDGATAAKPKPKRSAKPSPWFTAYFERFWAVWPNKVDRKRAELALWKAWPTIPPDPAAGENTAEGRCRTLLDAVAAYDAWRLAHDYKLSGPTPWINGARWTDDYAAAKAKAAPKERFAI